MLMKEQKCKVKNCNNNARFQMMCSKHYRRYLKYGDSKIKLRGAPGEHRICKVDGCSIHVRAFGLCGKHHRRYSLYGSTDPSCMKKAPQGSLKKLVCKHVGCKRHPSSSKHMLCGKHWLRYKKHGTTSNKVLVNLRSLSLKDRLLRSIKKNSKTGCWEWQRGLFSNGYGQISIKKKGRMAHRVSYDVFKGKIPSGKLVLHECDNTICINPNHLFLGTHKDNMKDMVQKGRSALGSKNSHAKLFESDVIIIKRKLKNHKSMEKLAERFNVTVGTIALIKKGKTWKHVII